MLDLLEIRLLSALLAGGAVLGFVGVFLSIIARVKSKPVPL